jgi:tRNA modification GTPase
MLTMAARLTAPGKAALATIGILGPDAGAMASRLFRPRVDWAATDRHYLGHFGQAVHDRVVLRVVRHEPIDEIELHCHGGPALVEELLGQLAALGAVIVDGREYLTQRGASASDIELMEALAECSTARCAQILLDQAQGALEAALDRIEEQCDGAGLERILRWSQLGLHLTRPWKVLLFGRTNVGKSSLLNAMGGFQRAIVASTPGTTRDVVRLRTAFDGWPVELGDGAGFRDAPQPIERAGTERLTAERAAADLAVMVVDLSEPPTALDASLRRDLAPDLVVGNKADLPSPWPAADLARLDARVSALSGAGIDSLAQRIARWLVPHVPEKGEAVPFTERQVLLVKETARRIGYSS